MKDFRGDLATISLPVLVIHGDQDRVLPYEAYGHGLGDLPGDQIELVAGVPGSDGGTAAVSGDDRAGDVAGFGRGEEGDHAGELAGLSGPGQQGRGAMPTELFGRCLADAGLACSRHGLGHLAAQGRSRGIRNVTAHCGCQRWISAAIP